MTAYLGLFSRLIVRPLRHELVRTALIVAAVALGVAVVIAIDLASNSAADNFHSSLEALVGTNDLLINQTGGLDEQVLGKLAQLPYAFAFSPRIEAFASVNGGGEAIPFFGLDLIAYANSPQQANLDSGRGDARQLQGDPVWASVATGLKPGDQVKLLINDQLHTFTVAGTFTEGSRARNQKVFITDIGLAQQVTGEQGRLDSIDVQLPSGNTVAHWEAVLRRVLPPAATIQPQGARTQQNRKMLSAFRWNLHILSCIALLVGAFLIYNTISISVVRRRAEIGILRALGASKLFILLSFLFEALLFAIAGGAIGVLLGRVMAIGAVRLVGVTVEALYISSQPSAIHLTFVSVGAGVALGIVVSLLAALMPAWEAAQVPAVEAMARGRIEYVTGVRSRRLLPPALLLLVTAGLLTLLPPIRQLPIFGFISVLVLVAGASLLIPSGISGFVKTAGNMLRGTFGIEALIALRALRASLRRTSVLTAALGTAIAMATAIAVMVGSFRETVLVWMNNELRADLYLRPAGPPAVDVDPTMPDSVADAIAHIPGVAGIDRFRAYSITYDGLPATLAGGERSKLGRLDTTRFLPGENGRKILNQLPEGDYCVVSEPFANKHHIRVGDTLQLPVGSTRHAFRVIGIYYDYSSERGLIIVARNILLKFLPDTALSSLAVYIHPGADAAAVRNAIDRAIAGRAILVMSNSSLRTAAITIFDQTFRITYALEAVAVVVAVLGIVGALLALIIDRRREFALLRLLGASREQVRGVLLFEAALLGLFSNVLGILLGLLLSLILIYVINKQSFGWTIQFHPPWELVLYLLCGIYAATVLAGLYPARLANSLQPVDVLHEE